MPIFQLLENEKKNWRRKRTLSLFELRRSSCRRKNRWIHFHRAKSRQTGRLKQRLNTFVFLLLKPKSKEQQNTLFFFTFFEAPNQQLSEGFRSISLKFLLLDRRSNLNDESNCQRSVDNWNSWWCHNRLEQNWIEFAHFHRNSIFVFTLDELRIIFPLLKSELFRTWKENNEKKISRLSIERTLIRFRRISTSNFHEGRVFEEYIRDVSHWLVSALFFHIRNSYGRARHLLFTQVDDSRRNRTKFSRRIS